MERWPSSLAKLTERTNNIDLRRVSECTKEREREREGWPPPFLLLFLTWTGRWPPSSFLSSVKGWGASHQVSEFKDREIEGERWPPPL